MGRVLIARHPETLANAEGRYLGRSDSPWTERGREQCKALASYMEAWKPTLTLSSPLPRALKAAHLATPCTVPLRVHEDLIEIDFGAVDGLTFDEARHRGLTVNYVPSTGSAGEPLPFMYEDEPIATGGETWRDFAERIERVTGRLLREEGRYLVVTHGGVARAVIARMLDLPLETMWRFSMPVGGRAELEVSGGCATLVALGPLLDHS